MMTILARLFIHPPDVAITLSVRAEMLVRIAVSSKGNNKDRPVLDLSTRAVVSTQFAGFRAAHSSFRFVAQGWPFRNARGGHRDGKQRMRCAPAASDAQPRNSRRVTGGGMGGA
jgi:hypothetical protein